MTKAIGSSFLSRVRYLFGGGEEQHVPSSPKSRSNRFSFAHSSKETLDKEPGLSHISYDEELIGNLNRDHRELEKLFVQTTERLTEGKYLEAKHSLEDFYQLLRDHVIEENVKLYCGLDSMFRDIDENNRGLAKEMKSEMMQIQLAIKSFVSPYLKVGFNSESSAAFLAVWVGQAGDSPEAIETQRSSIFSQLKTRIAKEEGRLYRVYESIGQETVNNGSRRNS